MLIHPLAALLALTLLPVAAAGAAERPISDEEQYQACLVLVQRQPEEAFESALAWRDQGGGVPARHCEALALVALRLYQEAAERLERLADEMQARGMRLQDEVLGQAGNAWLLAGQPDRAYGALSAALAVQPASPDLLIDRARALAARDDLPAALRDLDRAIAIDGDQPEALAFRASARRQLGDTGGALADAEAALQLDGENLEALLERGILRRQSGDTAGARADWLKVALIAPGTPAADAAQAHLADMDLQKPD